MLKKKSIYIIPILSFAIVILVSFIMLLMPFSRNSNVTDLDAFFTAVSATCVNGLSTVNLATDYTFIGQIIIAITTEIGAIGFITFISFILSFMNKKMSITESILLSKSINNNDESKLKQRLKEVIKYTLIIELIGSVFLAFEFVPKYGFNQGIWYSIFHSITAFCNAGFDLFGTSSFIPFKNDIYINIVVISLMLLGGIGFFIIEDLIKCFKKKSILHMEFHTKIILTSTLVIYTLSVILIKIAEPSLSILQTLFTAATCRTTGFSTVNLGETSSMLKLILSILMMIGGAPGSTSGGIRITSIAVVILIMKSVFENKKDVICFYKKIDDNTIKQAITNIFLSITIVFIGILLFARIQDISLVDNIFMCVSSFSATGLNVFSPSILNTIAKFILMTLMFIGRVGPISIVSVFILNKTENKNVEYVSGKLIL